VSDKDYLTMKDVGSEVVIASGKPNPTKYGQLHSMYDSRLWTSQPTNTHNHTYICLLKLKAVKAVISS